MAFARIIKLFTWLLGFEWWVYIIAIVSVIFVVIIINIIKYKLTELRKNIIVSRQTIKDENTNINEADIKDIQEIVKQYNTERIIRPRCGSQLVKRHCPYGYFWGCASFSWTKCKYKRKYL